MKNRRNLDLTLIYITFKRFEKHPLLSSIPLALTGSISDPFSQHVEVSLVKILNPDLPHMQSD